MMRSETLLIAKLTFYTTHMWVIIPFLKNIPKKMIQMIIP